MANKTRSDIINQVYEYVPNMNVDSHDTAMDTLIDMAVEYISAKHNFSYLRATSPATHAMAENEWYVDESDFSFTNFKELLFLEWIKSSTGENAEIKYLPQPEYQDRFRYVEYSGNTDGKPEFYTRVGQRYLFNCQFDEAVTLRAWYQQYHGAFASDSTSHSFQPDMLGFNAIVSVVIQEAQRLIPGLQLNPKSQQALVNAAYWIEQLIAADMNRANEKIRMEPKHKREVRGSQTDPYYWV